MTFPYMCGWTSASLACLCIEVGTGCQWAVKVILYDVCKWFCYEMSPSLRKRRSAEVTWGWEEKVWWIMYLYAKGVIRLCMSRLVEEHHSHWMGVFSPMLFCYLLRSLFPILSFPLWFSPPHSLQSTQSCPNKPSFSHLRGCFCRTPALPIQNILAYFYTVQSCAS